MNVGQPLIKLGGTYNFSKKESTPSAAKKGFKFVKKIGGGDRALRLKSRNKEEGVNTSNVTINCDFSFLKSENLDGSKFEPVSCSNSKLAKEKLVLKSF